MDADGYYYSLAEAYWIECQDAYVAAIKRYFTQQYEEDEDVDEHKLDLSNQSTSSQFHVTYDPVVTVLKHEWDDLHKRVADLEAQREADYQRLYKAVQPLVAGGSEYTGWSGIERGIRTIGERMRTATKREIAEIQERKAVERQRDDLAAALRPFAALYGMYAPKNGIPHSFMTDEMGVFGNDTGMFTVGDLKTAAEALRGAEGESNATA